MRIAIYSRKSKETDVGESVNNQVKMCKEYFRRNYDNCEFKIFEDEGFSGGNTNRPSFKHMIQLAEHKQFDIIACYKIDRIARNITDFFSIYSKLEKANVKLVSITEGFDASTPIGRMLMTMLAGFADMERENIKQRITDNLYELAKLGRWSGGRRCPMGYKSCVMVNNGKKAIYLELIPEYEKILCDIFRYAAEGYSCTEIGRKLNIHQKSINNIIKNPTYLPSTELASNYLKSIGYAVYGDLNGLGFMPYNRISKKSGSCVYDNPDKFVATSKHITPISDAIWIKANEQLISRAVGPRSGISQISFLAKLVKCKCGCTMTFDSIKNKKGEKTFYLRCSDRKKYGTNCDAKWIRVEDIEKGIIEKLNTISLDKNELIKFINKNKSTDYSKDIDILKKEITKKISEINKLTENLIHIEGPAINIITDKINNISSELEMLKGNLQNLEREQILNSTDLNIDTLSLQLRKMLEDFNQYDMRTKQINIRNFIKSIEYDGVDKFIINPKF